ncbi:MULTISPECIES: TIGR03086 family metal-binding protein [Actinomadura]|uniref:TIGR03086 family protein n=1 Tax=Actinomadura madurae TaxID=1993 RepID=A0A1I5LTT6_9ACTN|nr:TIGR03086 family metal-binding protein [Actinomadura madurae]SFP00769.1 TIGR03086 family protein [Actinomadura madurae]
MTPMPDLAPATRRMAALLAGVRDFQLDQPTPCADTSLGALIDHVNGLTLAFTWAAKKDYPEGGTQPPSTDRPGIDDEAPLLPPDWRTRMPEQLDALADAWRDPAAWEGMTHAGGIDLPGADAGNVAMNELVVHGWDIARASGQPYEVSAEEIESCLAFVAPSVEQSGGKGVPGLFGPAVDVPEDAPALDRLIAMTGRDPSWTAERN